MKTKTFIYNVGCMILLTLIALFSNCKKEGNSSENSYRIVSLSDYTDNVADYISTFKYDGEHLTEIYSVDIEMDNDSSKTLITYPDGQNVISTDYYKDMGQWVEDYRNEMVFEGDLLISSTSSSFYDGYWEPFWRIINSYEDGKKTNTITYIYDSGEWYQFVKNVIEYNDNKITQKIVHLFDTDWVQYYKYVYNYSGDNLTSIVSYTCEAGVYLEDYKEVMTYNGSQVVKYEVYYFEDGMWISDDSPVSFTYDEFGNVLSYNYDEFSSEKEVFTYEKGVGNALQVYFDPNGQFDYIPMPTKSDQIMKFQKNIPEMHVRIR